MGIFGKSKTEEKKKVEEKSAAVSAGKNVQPEAKKSMKELYGAKDQEKTATTATVVKGVEIKSSFAKAAEDRPNAKRDSSASAAYRVLLRPMVTEKGSHLGIENKYLFEVDYNANKIEVAKAIEAAYGIRPTKVNIMKFEGKKVRRGRNEGRRKRWKKAIVTLPAGKTIQIYEGI